MKEVAIVILNYNGRDYLNKFLPGLIQFSTPHEVIVADNASTDDSIDLLRNQFPEVRLIILPENYGYAGGYNEALKRIEANYYILVNSDIEVTEGWVEPLIKPLRENDEVVAVQPKIRSYHEKEKFEYAGAAGGYIDWLGYPFCRGRIFDELEEDNGQYDNITEIFWSSGACFAIRRDTFHELHGFESEFFAHMEEIDLCWRIQNTGKKILFTPESVVYHVGGGTLSSLNPRKTFLNFRNGLFLLVRNNPLWRLFYIIPVRSALDLVAAIKFIFEGNGNHALAIVKAHWQAATPSFRYLREQESKKGSSNRYISSKSTVFQYFIRKKRKYSQIKFKWDN
ncbi:MAG: glycosyltransferase family 2 protein [Cyclobacteriaceae bacterium]